MIEPGYAWLTAIARDFVEAEYLPRLNHATHSLYAFLTKEQMGERYILRSVVLTSKRVKEFWRSELLPHLWKRNRETNVVAFSLDRQDRLVGQIEQLAETVDVDELAFYIALLVRECDRFEYALTGQDQE